MPNWPLDLGLHHIVILPIGQMVYSLLGCSLDPGVLAGVDCSIAAENDMIGFELR